MSVSATLFVLLAASTAVRVAHGTDYSVSYPLRSKKQQTWCWRNSWALKTECNSMPLAALELGWSDSRPWCAWHPIFLRDTHWGKRNVVDHMKYDTRQKKWVSVERVIQRSTNRLQHSWYNKRFVCSKNKWQMTSEIVWLQWLPCSKKRERTIGVSFS